MAQEWAELRTPNAPGIDLSEEYSTAIRSTQLDLSSEIARFEVFSDLVAESGELRTHRLEIIEEPRYVIHNDSNSGSLRRTGYSSHRRCYVYFPSATITQTLWPLSTTLLAYLRVEGSTIRLSSGTGGLSTA